MLRNFGLGAVAGAFLLAFASLPAAAVIVDVDVESAGEPMAGVTISFETTDGEVIDVAEVPEEPVEQPPAVTEEPVEQPPAVTEEPPAVTADSEEPSQDPPVAVTQPPVVAVETDDDGNAVVELDDRHVGEQINIYVLRDGNIVAEHQVVLTAGVNPVTISIPPVTPPGQPVVAGPPLVTDPPFIADPGPQVPGGPVFRVFASGMVGTFEGPPQDYFATEVNGVLELGAVRFNPDATVTSVEGGGVIWLNPVANGGAQPFISVKVGQHDVDDAASFGDLSAPFGLPGTGDADAVFPAGVFFGADGVVATDLRAGFEQSGISGHGAIGGTFPFDGITIGPYVGFEISAIDQKTTFGGTVEPFPIALKYTTDLDIRRTSIELGAMVTVPLPGNFFAVELFAQPAVHFDFTSVSGTDRLRLSGFVEDDQSVPIGKKSTNFGGSISGGFRFTPPESPFTIDIGGMYSHRAGGAVIERTGELGDTSSVRIKDVDVLVGFVRGSFALGPH